MRGRLAAGLRACDRGGVAHFGSSGKVPTSMRIGFDHYTIAHRGLSPEATLEFACAHGLEGVQFLEPSSIDPTLDPARLSAFRARADAMDLYIEVGLPSPNPVRRARAEGRPVSAEEHARELSRHAVAVAALGLGHARAYIGDRHDRFRTDVSWAEQVGAAGEVLRHLRPLLHDLVLRVAIETHADLTTDELLALIDGVGDDIVGVTLDTGNLAMRLDDPLKATERLAPRVLATHVKDAALAFTPRGLWWQARPVGSGIVPIAEMIGLLHAANPDLALSIELHPRTYDLPIYDPTWLGFFPDLRLPSLAAVIRLAATCERRFADGTMPHPEEVEAIPWEQRDAEWLDRSVEYLRGVVGRLG